MEIQTQMLSAIARSGEATQIAIVTLSGDIDSKTAAQVQQSTLAVVRSTPQLLLELTQVSYMSSAGLRVLLSVHRQVEAHAGQIVLVGLNDNIKDTMAVTGFLDFFTVCDSLDQGCAVLQVQAAPSTPANYG
jgi:anti-sigma B factor antagonist